ncbi:MAG: nuclear transport factor 2 family protein [Cyclobacteriaceae bacterium]|nr:MAG: nuclear transport factor 2 family protein [Cyclobacteriaceae bacterium]
MNKIITVLILTAFSITGCVEDKNETVMETRIQTIEDKLAIKQVVDVFSNLADTKEIDKQVLLFTEDGIVESGSGDNKMTLSGRKQLFDAFSGYLASFSIVYHQNGQQTIDELTANTAKTTSYCRVILIGNQNGQPTKITHYVIYNDQFVKQNGEWLIKKRHSNFVRTETE